MRLPSFIRNLMRDALLNVGISSPLLPRGLRWRVLRLAGLPVSRSTINPNVYFGGRNISIAPGAFINVGVFIDNSYPVAFGADCSVGPNVSILTGTHSMGPASKRAGLDTGGPISIGAGAWVGGSATILSGVTIGAGAVVAAGAVVVRDCAPNGLYAGVPARQIRELDSEIAG
jgi:maltose O-acetyltransferase